MKKSFVVWLMLVVAASMVLAGCGKNDASGSESIEKVMIGYFPNINHAAAMVAKEKGYYEEFLGDHVDVEYRTFPDGGTFMTALKTGDLQAGLVGPGPAMNNFSNGADVKVLAAGSTGGTVIVARADSGINTIEDLQGKTFISPGVGCTHDVQFETYMKEHGITSSRTGGTMNHITGKPALYANMFDSGKIDVATAPEPWASVIIEETGAKIIIDHDTVSFGQTLPAAVFATNGELVREHPELVQQLIDAHKKATDYINEHPEEAKKIVIDSIRDITGQELSASIVDEAWNRIHFTYEVDQEAIQAFSDSSFDLGFLKEKPDLTGLIDTSFLD